MPKKNRVPLQIEYNGPGGGGGGGGGVSGRSAGVHGGGGGGGEGGGVQGSSYDPLSSVTVGLPKRLL